MTESKNRVADSSNLIDSGRGFSYKFKDNKLMIVVDLGKEKETYSSSYNSKKFCNTEFKGQNIGMLDGKYKLMLNLSVFRDLDWGSEEATSVADQRAEAKRKAQSYKR